MTVHVLRDAPPPELAAALARFEEQFTYPLGPGRTFRISHGDDYPRFFRAMGAGACFVAERKGEVAGVVGAALRPLWTPAGPTRATLYLGDLKLSQSARRLFTLPLLAHEVWRWARGRADAAFGVVMDGTPVTPLRYTGLLGIPQFQEVGRIRVFRLATGDGDRIATEWVADGDRVGPLHRQLTAGRYAGAGGVPAERSETAPLWLAAPDDSACGRLEDTRRAKRLVADDGVEMRSAHLSCFAYRTPDAGVALLRVALKHGARRGFPALFVAVPEPDGEAFCHRLAGDGLVVAPATVFGAELESAPYWHIDTAEI